MFSLHDPGLRLRPLHRIFNGAASVDSDRLILSCRGAFDGENVGSGPEAANEVWQHLLDLGDQGACGVYSANDQTWTLLTENVDTSRRLNELLPDSDSVSNSFSSSIVDELLLRDCLGLDPETALLSDSIADFESQMDASCSLAILAPPPSQELLAEAIRTKATIPRRSAQVLSRLVSGLVFNPLNTS